ncbi:hypothetical protein [Lacticaseibacillus salsurivasis]|uniref:hypothetical protein n=1 Tax=Lacticaseibacillus salsurivasis TaxID=3081441 RepID=UPI0030C6E462
MNNGFDDLSDFFDHAAKEAEAMNGEHEYTFDELFPPSFMMKYTHSASIDVFLSDLGVTDADSFEALPQESLEAKVQADTQFSSWKEMNQQAANDLFLRRTGLGQ